MNNNLKQFRTDASMTLQSLGDAVGSSKTYMHDLESESSPVPGLLLAYKLAKVLDKTVYDIWPDTVEIVEETIILRRVKIRTP